MRMSDELLKAGVKALRSGDKREARRLFGQLVNDEPDDVAAWWYLAATLDDGEQKVHCLRQVLRLRPDHEEAQQMLTKLKPHITRATPPLGTEPPVIYEAQDEDDTLAVVPDEGDESAPVEDLTVAIVAVLIALAAIVGTVILVWTGGASKVLGIRDPQLEPTLRQLIFDVPACAMTGDETAAIVFINNTGVAIDVLRGPQGEEEHLLTLEPGEQGLVEVLRPDALVRYAVATQAEGVTGGGVIIEVPSNSTCRVPVK